MKDSFGGTIMIYIFIFFLGLYIVFIALTLRYAQSFKLKNKLIDAIELTDGISDSNTFEHEVENYLLGINVKPETVNISVVDINDININEKCYYVVSSSIEWKWPFLGIEGNWVIKGETKNVKYCNDVTIDPTNYNYHY